MLNYQFTQKVTINFYIKLYRNGFLYLHWVQRCTKSFWKVTSHKKKLMCFLFAVQQFIKTFYIYNCKYKHFLIQLFYTRICDILKNTTALLLTLISIFVIKQISLMLESLKVFYIWRDTQLWFTILNFCKPFQKKTMVANIIFFQ